MEVIGMTCLNDHITSAGTTAELSPANIMRFSHRSPQIRRHLVNNIMKILTNFRHRKVNDFSFSRDLSHVICGVLPFRKYPSSHHEVKTVSRYQSDPIFLIFTYFWINFASNQLKETFFLLIGQNELFAYEHLTNGQIFSDDVWCNTFNGCISPFAMYSKTAYGIDDFLCV